MRADPPTLDEQRADAIRQERIKVLAAQANARWAAKSSLLNHPNDAKQPAAAPLDGPDRGEKGQPVPPFDTERAQPHASDTTPREDAKGRDGERLSDAVGKPGKEAKPGPSEGAEDPWKAADARRGGPSETWQPQAWDPNVATPRRR